MVGGVGMSLLRRLASVNGRDRDAAVASGGAISVPRWRYRQGGSTGCQLGLLPQGAASDCLGVVASCPWINIRLYLNQHWWLVLGLDSVSSVTDLTAGRYAGIGVLEAQQSNRTG